MKKLHISTDEKIIAGVCGGIAETYDFDVSLVRLTFILVTLLYGTGVLIYIAMALIIPKKESQTETGEIPEPEQKDVKLYRVKAGKMIAGICAGLAERFDIDVSIIRIGIILTTIFSSGLPILLYIIIWVIVPYKD